MFQEVDFLIMVPEMEQRFFDWKNYLQGECPLLCCVRHMGINNLYNIVIDIDVL